MPLPRLVDSVLDRLVVPGYSRLGYAARRAAFRTLPPRGMAGRTVIVTGADGGLGLATARGLAGLGARVELVVRDREGGERARDAVLAEHPGAGVEVAVCDVSSLADVRRYAAEVRDREPAVHGLVHAAGLLAGERTETAEGHEVTLATHVLGPFLLTRELRPLLRAGAGPTAPSRVVLVSSAGMYAAALRTDDLQARDRGWSGGAVYARTRRMQVVLAELLADDLAGDGIVVHSMHPGWADTPGLLRALPGVRRVTGPLRRTDDQGADTAVWLQAAAEPGHSTGVFWHDRAPRPTHWLPRAAESPQARAALWTLCVDATSAT